MGFRFYKRINILPGLSINLGKKGASLSVGPRGAKMTIGPNGTRTSVGIPGTGIRYEKRYGKGSSKRMPSGGGGDGSFQWIAGMIIFGIGAIVALILSIDDKTGIVLPMAGFFGALFGVSLLRFIVSACQDLSTTYYAKSKKYALSVKDIKYIEEIAGATRALYEFLQELSRSRKCQRLLKALPGMEAFDRGKNYFTINRRLAALVYCDVRSCFRRLGYDEGNLQGLNGIGYAMFVTLLINKEFDLSVVCDQGAFYTLLRTVSELKKTTAVEMNIEGKENEYRFGVVFGIMNEEYELVQRFLTHLYRWASLVAKADGQITPREQAALSDILKKYEAAKDECFEISGGSTVGDDFSEVSSECEDEEAVVDVEAAEEEKSVETKKSIDEPLQALDNLIGLKPVKQDVTTLAKFIEIQEKRRLAGLVEAPIAYHCVFTGNPGTGKTTVARILADIYREMGVVNKGHLVETDRSGLVAEYVGQTAVKTNKVIDSALDGVLFIDEAYTLVQGGNNDYGGEAIATLLKRMEDDRDRLVVILAGYTDEMKRFIDSNPGLHSRFNRYINFPDYSAQELSEIFLLTAAKSQYVCNDDVKASLVQIMERAVQSKDENFGNGRYVRNLFEKAIQRQAVRLSSVAPITTEMLTELTLHDLGFEYED
jgi:SpoVK/Ycf46/Vps4 family AAA+-type ATPase